MFRFVAIAVFVTVNTIFSNASFAQLKTDQLLDTIIEDHKNRWAKLAEKKTASLKEVEAIRNKTLDRLPPLSKLSPSQIRKVNSIGLFQWGKYREEAITELDKYIGDQTLQGAVASYLRMLYSCEVHGPHTQGVSPAEHAPKQRAAMKDFFQHPQLGKLLESEKDLNLFFLFGMLAPRDIVKEFENELFDLHSKVINSDQGCGRFELTECYSVLNAIASEQNQAQLAQVRSELVAHGDKAIKRLEAADPIDQSAITLIKQQLDFLESASAKGTLIGTAAKPLKIIWSNDASIRNWRDIKSNVRVLYFSTPGCGPCVKSVPKLIEVNRKLPSDAVFVGITSQQGFVPLKSGIIECQDDLEKELKAFQKYIAESKLNWPVVFSEEDVFNIAYGVKGVPHMVILDHEGVLQDAFNPSEISEIEILKRINSFSKTGRH